MKRYFGNEFNYNTKGYRYSKKAWTPETEEWFYRGLGGVPYNPQENTYTNEKFLRRKGIPNSFRLINDDDDRPGFGPGGSYVVRRRVPVKVTTKPKDDLDDEIMEINNDDNKGFKTPKKRLTLENVTVESNTHRKTEEQVPMEDISVVHTNRPLRSFDASNPMDRHYKRTMKTRSGSIAINPRFKDKVRVVSSRPVKEKYKRKVERAAARPSEIAKAIMKFNNRKNERLAIKNDILKDVNKRVDKIEDRIGTLVESKADREIMDKNYQEFLDYKVNTKNLTKKDVEQLIFANYDYAAVANAVEGIIGGRPRLIDTFASDVIDKEDVNERPEYVTARKKMDAAQKKRYDDFKKFKKGLTENKYLTPQARATQMMGYGLKYLNDQMAALDNRTNHVVDDQLNRLNTIEETVNGLQNATTKLKKKINKNSRIQQSMSDDAIRQTIFETVGEATALYPNQSDIKEMLDEFESRINARQGGLSGSIDILMGRLNNLRKEVQTKHTDKNGDVKAIERKMEKFLTQDQVDDIVWKALNRANQITRDVISTKIKHETDKINRKATRLFNAALMKGFKEGEREKFENKFSELENALEIERINLAGLTKLFNEFGEDYVTKSLFDDQIEQLKEEDKKAMQKIAELEGRFSEFGIALDDLKKKVKEDPSSIKDLNGLINLIKKDPTQITEALMDDLSRQIELITRNKDYATRDELDRSINKLIKMNKEMGLGLQPTSREIKATRASFMKTPLGELMFKDLGEADYNNFVTSSLQRGNFTLINSLNAMLSNIINSRAEDVFNTLLKPDGTLVDRISTPMINKINGIIGDYNTQMNALKATVNSTASGNGLMFQQLKSEHDELTKQLAAVKEQMNDLQGRDELRVTDILDLQKAKTSLEEKINLLEGAKELVYSSDLNGMRQNIDFLKGEAKKFMDFYKFVITNTGDIIEEDLLPIKQSVQNFMKKQMEQLKPTIIEVVQGNPEQVKKNWLSNFLTNAKQGSPQFYKAFTKLAWAAIGKGVSFADPNFDPYKQLKDQVSMDMNERPEVYKNVINNPDGKTGKMILKTLLGSLIETLKDDISPPVMSYVYENLGTRDRESAQAIGLVRNVVRSAIVKSAPTPEFKKVMEKTVDGLPVIQALDHSIKNIKSGEKYGKHRYPKHLYVDKFGHRWWVEDKSSRAENPHRTQTYEWLEKAIQEFLQLDPASAMSNLDGGNEFILNNALMKIRNAAKIYATTLANNAVARDYSERDELINDQQAIKEYYKKNPLPDHFVKKLNEGNWKTLWNPIIKMPVIVQYKDQFYMFKNEPYRIGYNGNDKGILVLYQQNDGKVTVPNDPLQNVKHNAERQHVFYNSREAREARERSRWWETNYSHYNTKNYTDLQMIPFVMKYFREHPDELDEPIRPEGMHVRIVNPKDDLDIDAVDGEIKTTTPMGNTRTLKGNYFSLRKRKFPPGVEPDVKEDWDKFNDFMFERKQRKEDFKNFASKSKNEKYKMLRQPNDDEHDFIIETETPTYKVKKRRKDFVDPNKVIEVDEIINSKQDKLPNIKISPYVGGMYTETEKPKETRYLKLNSADNVDFKESDLRKMRGTPRQLPKKDFKEVVWQTLDSGNPEDDILDGAENNIELLINQHDDPVVNIDTGEIEDRNQRIKPKKMLTMNDPQRYRDRINKEAENFDFAEVVKKKKAKWDKEEKEKENKKKKKD